MNERVRGSRDADIPSDPPPQQPEGPQASRESPQPLPPADSLGDDTLTADSTSGPGTPLRIGPYKILQKLGQGGMGEVYHAEQQEPVRRPVALKLIKLGMDTKEVIARFESERQALALLNHPSIAHVLDAGSTPEGRPYFVMEFVQGIPITTYCREQRLSIPERLRLFCEVCEGVQHAHQKGIIHRDLKPSNILITVQGKKSAAKIIDFGVAKATAQRLTDRTLVTEVGFAVGTPGYMSPEQAGATALDIDTRSDVYSLGVVLYELLVGEIPFGTERLKALGMEGYARALREKDPQKPSTRLEPGTEGTESAARERRTQAIALRRQIQGDLDWIVLMALERDRTRRYGSVSDLAEDIRRHLRHEPVTAGPPSTLYRVLKFVRRHRAGVAATAVVMFALVIGLLGMSTGLLRALRAEREARQEAETARQVSNFLVELFRVSDPDSLKGSSVTAREILDRGSERIHRELADQPIIRARLMGTMGEVYWGLGLLDRAEMLFEEALAIQEAVLPEDSRELIRNLRNLGALLHAPGGTALVERALVLSRKNYGLTHEETASTMYTLGTLCVTSGDVERGVRLLRDALESLRTSPRPNRRLISWCLNDLAIAFMQNREWAKALPLLEEAAEIKTEILGMNNSDTAKAHNNLGYCLTMLGNYEEAEPLLHSALDRTEQILGANHLSTSINLHSLGELYRRKGDRPRAIAFFERALRIQEQHFRPAHGYALLQQMETVRSIAAIESEMGLLARAEQRYRHAIRSYEEIGGAEYPSLASCLEEYAIHLTRSGMNEEAARALARARTIREGDATTWPGTTTHDTAAESP